MISFVAIERVQKKACLLQFIFAVDQQLACTSEFICWPERAGLVHTGGACTGDARAEAFVFARSLFLGGVLLRIDCHGCWNEYQSSP